MEHFIPKFNNENAFPLKKFSSTEHVSQIHSKSLSVKSKLVWNIYAIVSNEHDLGTCYRKCNTTNKNCLYCNYN